MTLGIVACEDDVPADSGSVGGGRDRGLDAGSDGGAPDAGRTRDDAGSAAAAGDDFGFGDQGVDPVDAAGDPVAPAPPGWSCPGSFARDGVCDCGCGAPDPDCGGAGCTAAGCSTAACQVCFSADGSTRDCDAPGAWSCRRALQGDGVCDCGCGAPDPDCDALGCYLPGCSVPACERCPLADGEACAEPAAFTCDAARIGDGVCDCGCGNVDPDCRGASCSAPGCTAPACERCSDADGQAVECSVPEPGCTLEAPGCDCGCGVADPECGDDGCTAPGCQDAACESCHDAAGRPVPCPGAWRCPPERFADGDRCDCGCGRPDPDCGEEGCSEPGCEQRACGLRHDGEGRAIRPQAWVCDAGRFDALDGCDCGCGAPDPDCRGGCTGPGCVAPGCDVCHDGAGTFDCRFRCAPGRMGDGVCDCGCGTLDPDCGETGCAEPGCFAEGCELCEGEAGPLACERGACPAGFDGDGVCDCGCRDVDVDCITAVACVEPGCSEAGCGRCHDALGAVLSCDDWVCGLEKQGGGDGCNCGCGAPDPDCADDEGCSGPGCLAEGCITCRAADGSPMGCAPEGDD